MTRTPLPDWTPDVGALDLLISVAETGSLGRAARLHGISQPSASARLARLERQIGSSLLVRGARGSTLTPTGETVAAWARAVVDSARHLTEGISALRADRAARLRVAASLTVAEYLLPRWMLLLRRRHPDLDVSVVVVNSHAVVEHVRAGRVDLGFIESPDSPEDLAVSTVGEDRLTLVVARAYPLAARSHDVVTVQDVVDQPLLVREPGSGTRETFMRALSRLTGSTTVPPHTIELGSTATIVATTAAGGGIGVVSASAVRRQLSDGAFVEIRVAGLDLSRPLRATWQDRITDLAHELVDIARRDAG